MDLRRIMIFVFFATLWAGFIIFSFSYLEAEAKENYDSFINDNTGSKKVYVPVYISYKHIGIDKENTTRYFYNAVNEHGNHMGAYEVTKSQYENSSIGDYWISFPTMVEMRLNEKGEKQAENLWWTHRATYSLLTLPIIFFFMSGYKDNCDNKNTGGKKHE